MSLFALKPTSSYVKKYYAALAQFATHGHTTEGNTRSAFADLLKRAAGPYDWHLVEEYQFKGTNKQPLRADGALVDSLTLVHGLWEAKDSADDLAKEIKAKVAKGYPLTNILFQSPTRAVLYQDSHIKLDCDLTQPENLVEVLQLFFDHRQPHEVDWEEAVFKFSEKIPDLAQGVTTILEAEHKKNADFRQKFQAFADLCRQSINPDLTDPAIQKMLVQHLLTARIFIKVFKNEEFLRRNVIATEIEKVIDSITSRYFSRTEFLKPLDRFYTAIEKAAESQEGYTEKQHFLNAVYEKFFQSFDRKQADTHGIVYTPQPIVDFMVRSVEEILKSEFGKSLSDEGVHILDPFTGTGNFITRIMQQIKTSRLPQKYAHELHCNEIMLLPYYIASMNIEHAYMERVGQYATFEGICLADTFELAESRQTGFSFMSEANTERVKRQKRQSIFVVIGNPPYNAAQDVENDNNRNRKYKDMHERIWETYAQRSEATLLNTLNDPYIQAFRWATDRLGEKNGVVAFVTNGRFTDGRATDSMRRSLAAEFDQILIVDLGGDVRSDPKLSGTTHNVFGIQTSVAVTILVRNRRINGPPKAASVSLVQAPHFARKQEKLDLLGGLAVGSSAWSLLPISGDGDWRIGSVDPGFEELLPLGSKVNKRGASGNAHSLFHIFSNGCQTNRDTWAFNFSEGHLRSNIETTILFYNEQLGAIATLRPTHDELSKLVRYDDERLSWSDDLRASLLRRKPAEFNPDAIRQAMYRPFTRENLYFDRLFNDRVCLMPSFFGEGEVSLINTAIGITFHPQVPFSALAVSRVVSRDFGGRPTQFFPYYVFAKNGAGRKENVTDWALAQYRNHYANDSITKWDIFHSTYALLHHPEYRARYAANLKRELPRIPFPPDLHSFAAAGKRLMELHIDYEKQPEYPLEEIEHPGKPWTLRVEKMSLSKDKTDLRYNEALTLRGIPPSAFDYRLGNRSAVEWVIDQYRVSTDPRSGIVNDPNREDHPTYILRLIKQVITVSLETQQIIATLPTLNLGSSPTQPENA